jgi:membrane protein DedA with SNARE-associated domain
MIESFADTLLGITSSWGYLGIFFLMTIESSFIPFPSEVVVPPAAYLAYKGEMNVFLVVLFGVLGSLAGAIVNYVIARGLGRPVIYALARKKFAKYLLINEEKVHKAEQYFLKYGNASTFLGRLVPAVRQLISLPAGFSKMNIFNFLFYTFLGSALWVSVLSVLGYFFGANEDVFRKYFTEISIFFVVFVLLIVLVFYLVKRKKKKKIST